MQKNAKEPHPVDIEVGRRIKLQRKILGMSQNTLAEALGITFQQVQKYEKGANRVGSSRLSNIARILGVPVSYFFESGANGEGNAVDGTAILDPVMSLLETEEGRALNAAFVRISSAEVRKRVVGLVSALSKAEEHA